MKQVASACGLQFFYYRILIDRFLKKDAKKVIKFGILNFSMNFKDEYIYILFRIIFKIIV